MRKALYCVLVAAVTAAVPSHVPAQGQSKTLVMRTALPDNPLKILGLTVGDRPVPLDRRSGEDFDWAGPVAVRVRNVSSKQITSATADLIFPSVNAAAELLLLVVTFESAAPIGVNEEAVLKAESGGFKMLSERNTKRGYKINYNRIRLQPSIVRFEDGTVWRLGMTYDRDGNVIGMNKPTRPPKLRFLKAASWDEESPTCSGSQEENVCSALSTTGGGQCEKKTSVMDYSRGGPYLGYRASTYCGGPSPCSSFEVIYTQPEFSHFCARLE